MSDESSTTYKVGFGKPPREHQFQRGISGNPRGRPKRQRSLSDEISDFANEFIQVKQGDTVKTLRRRTVILEQLFARAVAGDVRAAVLFLGPILGGPDKVKEALDAYKEQEAIEATKTAQRFRAKIEDMARRMREEKGEGANDT